MTKKAVMVQPGKLGDVLLLAPIAKHYADEGYEVYWPVLSNFFNMVQRYDYVVPSHFNIRLEDTSYYANRRTGFFTQKTTCGERSAQFFNEFYKNFDRNEYKFIDPCFAFPGHQPAPQTVPMAQQWLQSGKSWIGFKYTLAEVPLRKRWNLEYTRDYEKETKLLEFIKQYAYKKYGSEEYSIVQTYQSSILPTYEPKNPINFSLIKGYEIVDWLQVLENALEIVCVDSCLCHFAEVSPSLKNIKKVYLGTEEPHYTPFMDNILFNQWTNLSQSDIAYNNQTLETI